jgi:hypothetical protein
MADVIRHVEQDIRLGQPRFTEHSHKIEVRQNRLARRLHKGPHQGTVVFPIKPGQPQLWVALRIGCLPKSHDTQISGSRLFGSSSQEMRR